MLKRDSWLLDFFPLPPLRSPVCALNVHPSLVICWVSEPCMLIANPRSPASRGCVVNGLKLQYVPMRELNTPSVPCPPPTLPKVEIYWGNPS